MTRKVNFTQVSGLGAIGFAAVIVLANLIAAPAGLPTAGADIGEVATFFSTQDGIVGLSSALTPLAWVLATLFGAGAVAVLRDGWSLVGFAGLLMLCGTFAGVVALRLALAATNGDSGLWALHDALFTLNGTFLTLALVGLSIGGRRAGLIPRWHATIGLLSAALLFTSATLTPVIIDHGAPLSLLGLVGWLIWVVWLVTYGITLLRTRAVELDQQGHRRVGGGVGVVAAPDQVDGDRGGVA